MLLGGTPLPVQGNEYQRANQPSNRRKRVTHHTPLATESKGARRPGNSWSRGLRRPHLKEPTYARSDQSRLASIGEAFVTYMSLVRGWHHCRLAAGRCSHSLSLLHRLEATHSKPVRCPFQDDLQTPTVAWMPRDLPASSLVLPSLLSSPILSASLSLSVSRSLWKFQASR